MSTILKALRRLEKEREVEAPGLRDQVLADAPPRDARPRFALLIGAGAIGAVFVVAGFTFLDGRFDSQEGVAPGSQSVRPSPIPPLAAPSAEIVSPAPKFQEPARATRPPRPRREAAPPPRATQPSQPVDPPRVASASRRAAAASAAVAPRAAAQPIETSTPIPTPAPASVAAPPPALDSIPAATPAPATAATPAPTPTATPDPTVVEAVEKIAGIMGQPEVARRAPLPSMVVQRTRWHPRSERRLAFLKIEGRTGIVELREGDAVGDAVVQQIDPSAVIFLHRGVEIRRRIGAGD